MPRELERVSVRLIGGTIALGFAITMLVWSALFVYVEADQRQALSETTAAAENLTRAFEENLLRSLRSMDQALTFMRGAYERDPEGFDLAVWSRSEIFREFSFQLSLVGPDGRLRSTSLVAHPEPIDLSDREHFKVHVERDRGLFISLPVLGRASGRWSVQLTRRLETSDGAFDGVLVVSLDPAHFTQLYTSLRLPPDSVLSVVREDGVMLARSGPNPPLGRTISESHLFHELTRAPYGVYRAESVIDGIERISAYRRVEAFPLVVQVGFSVAEARYRAARNYPWLAAAAGFLTLLTVAGIAILVHVERKVARYARLAQEGDRTKSRFLATMSHEIRTPLHGVLGITDLLASEETDGARISLLRTLRGSAEHLLLLINDLLDFARLESDAPSGIERRNVDATAAVRDVVAVLEPRAAAKGVAMEVHAEPASVFADPGRLRQILFNLVGNAVKFTDQGTIGVHVVAVADWVEIRVEDTGPGIDRELQQKLFREFVRGTSSRDDSTGLGLAIARRLARCMDGDVSCESEPGAGSCFTLLLPRAVHEGDVEVAPEPVESAPAPEVKLHRVLQVEDNPVNRMLVETALRKAGHEVISVVSGEAALEFLARDRADLILLDIMMPGMSGLETFDRIKALLGDDRPPVIALTANAFDHERAAYLERGIDAVVAKPFRPTELQHTVAEVIKPRRSAA